MSERPKPRVTFYELLAAYGRVHVRWNRGFAAMGKAQAEFWDAALADKEE